VCLHQYPPGPSSLPTIQADSDPTASGPDGKRPSHPLCGEVAALQVATFSGTAHDLAPSVRDSVHLVVTYCTHRTTRDKSFALRQSVTHFKSKNRLKTHKENLNRYIVRC
jgi:hypothetical protein